MSKLMPWVLAAALLIVAAYYVGAGTVGGDSLAKQVEECQGLSKCTNDAVMSEYPRAELLHVEEYEGTANFYYSTSRVPACEQELYGPVTMIGDTEGAACAS